MPASRLFACSDSVSPRPDGDGATPTSGVLLPRAEVADPVPTDTRVCALRRPSTSREPSPSLECQQAVGVLRFRTPLLWWFDVYPFGPDGGEEGVGEEGQ